MDPDVLLSKCITLLYRESQLQNQVENSADLIKTTIEGIKLGNAGVGLPTERDTILGLKNLVYEMCSKEPGHVYDVSELLQQIRIITNGNENLYNAIAQGVEKDLDPIILKRTITNMRKSISDKFRENRNHEIIAKAYRDLSFNRHKIGDVSAYIRNIILELEITSTKASAKDNAIVKSMNFGDDEAMRDVFSNVLESNSNGLCFSTGWRELNDALQGGPRPGDTMVTAALQHNYKTGFSLTVFTHIAVFNRPKNKDPNKKPLLYRVSLEDPLRNNAQFMYQLLKYEETKQAVSVKDISVDEMWTYVKKRMMATGYHILMEEVNPSNWTYLSLVNRIVELESEGYVVEVLQVDYLSKLPTTGCTQGSIGDDMMDMLSRIRAFCSSNGILFITPHQLSTEAKRLLQTVPQEQFLQTIKGGGFFEKSKGLDRIYDIGVLLHKCETQAGDFLHVVIDKHRFPTVADSHLKSFFLRMPSCKMPIPANLLEEDYKVLRKIPKAVATKDDAYFL